MVLPHKYTSNTLSFDTKQSQKKEHIFAILENETNITERHVFMENNLNFCHYQNVIKMIIIIQSGHIHLLSFYIV